MKRIIGVNYNYDEHGKVIGVTIDGLNDCSGNDSAYFRRLEIAEWKDDENSANCKVCSRCGRNVSIADAGLYCCNCGSKMYKAEEEFGRTLTTNINEINTKTYLPKTVTAQSDDKYSSKPCASCLPCGLCRLTNEMCPFVSLQPGYVSCDDKDKYGQTIMCGLEVNDRGEGID